MTFDMGNWHWVGECPLQAAQVFSSRVKYVHCKGVQRTPARWIAVPLNDSAAPWRAVFRAMPRSEAHTSELQSLMRISYAVFCLTKKKTTSIHRHTVCSVIIVPLQSNY